MLKGKTILLVEDEAMVAMLAEGMLRALGAADVVSAHTLTDGLAAAEEEIDAAVLDINLRGEMSFPIATRLSERAVPFVYATAYGASAVDGRPAPVVTKPYDEAALAAALNEAIGA